MAKHALLPRKMINFFMLGLCALGAGAAILVVCLMLGYIMVQGLSFINLDFIISPSVGPGQQGGGMRDEIIGTLVLVGLGSLIAVPLGMLTGVFLSEFGSPRVASAVRFAADVLAGVPSIVIGVFAYIVIVSPMKSYSAFSAGIALAIIMVPVVARTTEESMRLVPLSLREAALALGITRWRSVIFVAIPGALTGIVAGIMLGVARIAGETAPLLFTALGSNFPFDDLMRPISALPLQIYRYAMSPDGNWQEQAWAGAFLLVMLVLVISLVVRWMSRKRRT
ncbi:MAG: phosphate ABC transporter permease PstA [Dehalococcoidia bacterium]|jgi:phosphate transport system permease protein|nr:phosphate ABC transporter permease PstA [Dehalococcoidia bacterium]